jgi:RNA polymerase sigma-70 factor (ECF subfamily)
MRENLDWRADSQAPEDVPGAPAAPTPAKEQSERVAELFESHNRSLMRFLTCRLRSAQEAKEVAQEAYVRILQLDALSGISYLRAFLFKTAANLATDRLKSASRRGRIDQLEFFDITRAEPSAESSVSADQQLRSVMQAVKELPPKCRYAFIMNRCYGYELTEVAQLMNLSERMVRIYVERALGFCRERLMAEGDEK